jgi:hypothetical protein
MMQRRCIDSLLSGEMKVREEGMVMVLHRGVSLGDGHVVYTSPSNVDRKNMTSFCQKLLEHSSSNTISSRACLGSTGGDWCTIVLAPAIQSALTSKLRASPRNKTSRQS